MTLAGLEPAIFGSEDQRLIHLATGPLVALRLAQQAAGQSVGPTGQPDTSVLEPQLAAGGRPKIGGEFPKLSTGFEPQSLDSEPRVLAVTPG